MAMKTAPDPQSLGYDPIRLVELHQAGVWRYLRALGCDTSLADDLTQETFLAVFQRPFRELSAAATAAYLRRTAYNLWITLYRRTSRETVVDNVEAFDRVWDRWAGGDNGDELLEKLRVCLEQLSARARSALDMRFRDRRPRAVIAQSLAMTEHGARNLMQRAKKQLRTCIEGKLP